MQQQIDGLKKNVEELKNKNITDQQKIGGLETKFLEMQKDHAENQALSQQEISRLKAKLEEK